MPYDIAINSTYSGFTSSTVIWAFIPFAMIIAVILGMALVFFSYDWFKKYFKLVGFVGKSFIYFLKGCLVVICGLAIYGLYWILSQLSEQNYVKPEYYLYAILGYLGISALGYLADRWYKRMKEYKKRLKR
jgi:ABC-type dipeptide/oligopeptide/nickel transport system permease component